MVYCVAWLWLCLRSGWGLGYSNFGSYLAGVSGTGIREGDE